MRALFYDSDLSQIMVNLERLGKGLFYVFRDFFLYSLLLHPYNIFHTIISTLDLNFPFAEVNGDDGSCWDAWPEKETSV